MYAYSHVPHLLLYNAWLLLSQERTNSPEGKELDVTSEFSNALACGQEQAIVIIASRQVFLSDPALPLLLFFLIYPYFK
jgi:hypothetical protein